MVMVAQRTCVKQNETKTGQLRRKGWKIMTAHKRFAEMMNLRRNCPRNYKHAACEGAFTLKTAYYTSEYVRRYCEAILHEMSFSQLAQELNGTSQVPLLFGSGLQRVCPELL
jgi:hypothetical protein